MRTLILIACLTASCGLPPAHYTDFPSGIRYDLSCPCLAKHGASGLSFDVDYMWGQTPLNVSFENGTAEQKLWVQDAISRTWGKASKLEITWEPYRSDRPQQIWLGFGDTLEVDSIGVQLNHLKPGIRLGTARNDERDLRMQAVFAFGFALGFTAGQDRGDTQCYEYPTRFSGYSVTRLGPWDEHSTMNECNAPAYNNGVLSEGDITGMQFVYGEPDQDSCDCSL